MKRHLHSIYFFLLVIIFLFSLSASSSLAQTDTASIRKQLDYVHDRDQKCRTGKDSSAYMHYIDSTNLLYVEALIAQFGWPGKSFVGSHGNEAVFLVIQHADSATQVKYLPMMEQSVQKGESSASELALLQDRVLMRQGKKQIYGSQVVSDNKGGWMIYPIDDEVHVNERRAKLGMEPIEAYAKYFGIEYNGPAKTN